MAMDATLEDKLIQAKANLAVGPSILAGIVHTLLSWKARALIRPMPDKTCGSLRRNGKLSSRKWRD
jgi:hypothetical protein